METQKFKKTLAYIIDSDFKIVFSNKELKYIIPDVQMDRCCYEIFGNEKCQCKQCPIRSENGGSSILYDHLRSEWISVASAPIEIPGIGTCNVVINESMEASSRSFLYDAASKSDYAELLELDYLHDCFRVAYHGDRKKPGSPRKGAISDFVRRVAENSIHPDDRDRFCDFWLLDRVGTDSLPMQLFTARHGEFRRLRPDGGYDWVQQVMLPIRQSSPHEIFVNNFFNTIDMPTTPEFIPLLDTPICRREEFFHRAEELLAQAGDDAQWSLIAIDVERLKLFNEWYGRQAGDTLLKGISECLKQFQKGPNRVAGYFYDDDYAVLMPRDDWTVRQLYQSISSRIKQCSDKMNILPAFGIYTVTGSQESVYSMYDRALLACGAVKGNFSQRIKFFDTEMLEKLQAEYLLLSDVQKAFQNHEFTIYLQPKCNTETGKIAGAEALARWSNPEKGMVSPGIFVPFLEKSGLISELDTYIWEEVCKWQRSVLDRGEDPIPVSVNVSRIDIYAVDVAAYFQKLIQKYDLDPALIEIEITESAYAEDATEILHVVRSLRNAGFCVLMDDFGSAYSSLNMLRDIEVDVLKIDMRFLDFDPVSDNRGVNIVETICHMAHLLGLKIVAEGVENEAQRNLLLKAGCSHCQGYLFHRPMPVGEFESLIADPEIRDNADHAKKQQELFQLKDLMLQNAFSLNMLDNIIGAMAFYDVCGDKITVVQYNEQYSALFGDNIAETELDLEFGQQLYTEEHQEIFEMFNKAREDTSTVAEMDLRRRRADGREMWVNMRVFFLYSRNDHDIFYSTVRDVTTIHKSNEALQFLNNDMPGAYYRHLNDKEYTFTHISQRFLDIFGYTRQEIKDLFDDKFLNMVHPEDRHAVLTAVITTELTKDNYAQPCRMLSKHGYLFVMDQSRLVEYGNEQVFQGIILHNFDDYMWLNESENADDSNTLTTLMPSGFYQAQLDGDNHFGYVSNSLLRILGYSRTQFLKKFQNDSTRLVYSKDWPRVHSEVNHQLRESDTVACEHRIEMEDGSLKWVYSRGKVSTDRNGIRWLNTCIVDHDYLRSKYEIQQWQFLKYKSLSTIPGIIVFDYDPAEDRLTVEESTIDGRLDVTVAENYLQEIDKHGFISREHVAEQKHILHQASLSLNSGVTEFMGRFSKNSGYRWYRFRYTSLADEDGRVYRIIGRGEDFSSEKLTLSSLTHRVSKDSLTGLLNYESAREKVDVLLKNQPGGTLFLLDIDDFKSVNDTQGHLEGDRLLKMLSGIISTTFRKKGICARFGGDEFMVFIPGPADRVQSEALLQTFRKATARVQLTEGTWLRCSIGVAERPSDSKCILFDTLFRQADTALYESKRTGKNRYTFYCGDQSC